MKERSRVIHYRDGEWESIVPRRYKTEGSHFRSITRRTLLGEGPGEAALGFLTRYFEILPGGYSSLERHRHPHAVLVLRGRGRVLLDGDTVELVPFDCVYVAPETLHQFQAADDEPLGFLCIVDRERDRPRVVSPEEAGNGAARG